MRRGGARRFIQALLGLGMSRPVHDGRHAHAHELDALCWRLCDRYFGGPLDVTVGWGRASRGRASMTFGSYSFKTRRIRIHPRLDCHDVPAFFVESVLFHELVHHVVGYERQGGRRRLHTPCFREIEARYEHAERARLWQRENFRRLLGRPAGPRAWAAGASRFRGDAPPRSRRAPARPVRPPRTVPR